MTAASTATITIRPMRPDDGDRLVAFHARLSPESQRLRFFTAHPRLTDAEVWRFTHVDGRQRVALVAEEAEGDEDDEEAEDGGAIVGVARYDRLPHDSAAEAAFVVRDDHQGRGLGTVLLDHLAEHARNEGVTHLVAETLPENTRMLHLLRGFSPAATSRYADDVVYVTVPLDVPLGDATDAD
jgi:RimJ/RimL family protein N-acetyltransferase